MRDVFAALRPWAETLAVTENGVSRETYGFLEPVSAAKPEEQAVPTPAGVRERRRYRALLPLSAALAPGGELRRGDERFTALRVERYPSHAEALLERKAVRADA